MLVLRVQDLKTLRQPGFLPVTAQQAVRQTMKGTHPHACRRRLDHGLDTPAHLGSRLVGKGHGQDGVRR